MSFDILCMKPHRLVHFSRHARKADYLSVGMAAAFFSIIVALLLSLSITNMLRGPSSADDAWIALAAKNISTGKGYATSLSGSELIQFDPFISTGPTLVLPTALAIYVFGNAVWVPGAVQLCVFVVLFVFVTLLFIKRTGWPHALLYASVLLFFLIAASVNNWYFGALLGEPVAFGFIFLGLAILATHKDRWSALAAGFCFSLAILTKQISIFPVVGIICAWLAVIIYESSDRYLNIIKVFFAFLFGFLCPVVVFEGVKITALGVGEYGRVIQSTLDAAIKTDGDFNLNNRLDVCLDILFQSYARPAMAVIVIIVILVILGLNNGGVSRNVLVAKRVAAFAGAAATMHFVYILFASSNIWPRYLWIGIALFFVAILACLLAVSNKQRNALYVTLFIIIGLGGYRPIYVLQKQMVGDRVASERADVVSILDANQKVPYAAQYWSSIYDVVYLRREEGIWGFGRAMQGLYGNNFIAIINKTHTDKASTFFRSVEATCTPMKHSSNFELFECAQSFWLDYQS